MLRIRRIFDDVLPVNKEILQQVKEILRSRFTDVNESEIEQIDEKLRNPFKQRFRTLFFVAETLRGRVQGFAMLLHEPVIGFVYLDWIATVRGITSGGLGDALYDRVRREATLLKAHGVFFECLPDDPARCPDKTLLKDNRSRLRFYERYGARPIVNTGYEMPVHPEDACMPHLVYDGLEAQQPLRRSFARKVVRAVLERKYADLCPADYVERVVASITDDPLQLREFRYVKPEAVKVAVDGRFTEQIALVVNDKHTIHHVHERGYVESPVRVRSILGELEKAGFSSPSNPGPFRKSISMPYTMSILQPISERPARMCPRGNPSTPMCFPFGTKRDRRRNLRSWRDIIASTPLPPSTGMPIRRPAGVWTAP